MAFLPWRPITILIATFLIVAKHSFNWNAIAEAGLHIPPRILLILLLPCPGNGGRGSRLHQRPGAGVLRARSPVRGALLQDPAPSSLQRCVDAAWDRGERSFPSYRAFPPGPVHPPFFFPASHSPSIPPFSWAAPHVTVRVD